MKNRSLQTRKLESSALAQGHINNSKLFLNWNNKKQKSTAKFNPGLRINLPVFDLGCCTREDPQLITQEGQVQMPGEQIVKVTLFGQPMSYLHYRELKTERISVEPQRAHKKVPVQKIGLLSKPSNSDPKKVKIARSNVIFETEYDAKIEEDKLKKLAKKYYDELPKDEVTPIEPQLKQKHAEKLKVIQRFEQSFLPQTPKKDDKRFNSSVCLFPSMRRTTGTIISSITGQRGSTDKKHPLEDTRLPDQRA